MWFYWFYWVWRQTNPRLIIEKMSSAIHHRGPDNKDYYVDSNKEIALGHNRLSIIDLSEQANQPMFSSDKKSNSF